MRRDISRIGFISVAIMAACVLGGASSTGAVVPGANGKIVYVGGDGANFDIYTMNADGTGETQLTTDGLSNDNPEWSPDGTKISFDSFVDANQPNIYVMNADGTNRQRLTTTSFFEGRDFQATWAPDGNSLVFVSTRDGDGGYELYRMNGDGTEQTRLTRTDGAVDDWYPSVAPDGRIAFSSDRANTGAQFHDIYVMNADGTGVTRLTFDGGDPDDPFVPSHDALNAAWSPDGSRIAFDSTRSGDLEVWVMNADGSGLVNVSNHPDEDYEPAWSPDGTQILFTSTRAGEYDVWAVDAPPASSPAANLLTDTISPDTVSAASKPRNLTAGSNGEARSANWGVETSGGGNACTIKGTPKADTLTGTPRDDTICALGGNDTVYGTGGEDTIFGGSGGDTLSGQGGDDRVVGRSGADRLFGGTGDDRVVSRDGVPGNDALDGGKHRNGDTKVTDQSEKRVVGFP